MHTFELLQRELRRVAYFGGLNFLF